MKRRSWSIRSDRMKNIFTDKEIDLIMMELETEGLSEEIYRYKTKWGITVVYYMYDFRLLKDHIFKPIYLHYEDLYFVQEEEEFFQKILLNTITISQMNIMPFTYFLKELQSECEPIDATIIKGIIKTMENLEEENMLWCITGSLRERGSCGGFYRPLLKHFCKMHMCSHVLIGFGNNNYAFLSRVNQNTIQKMKILTYQVESILAENTKIAQKKILFYSDKNNTLEVFGDDIEKKFLFD